MATPDNTSPSQEDIKKKHYATGSLTTCKACGHFISPAARACPSCGHPLNRLKEGTSGFTYSGAGIVILSIMGFLGNSSGSSLGGQMTNMLCTSAFLSGVLFIGLGGIITLLRRLP